MFFIVKRNKVIAKRIKKTYNISADYLYFNLLGGKTNGKQVGIYLQRR